MTPKGEHEPIFSILIPDLQATPAVPRPFELVFPLSFSEAVADLVRLYRDMHVDEELSE